MTGPEVLALIGVAIAIFATMCTIFVMKDDIVDVISTILSYIAEPFFDAEENIVREFNHL